MVILQAAVHGGARNKAKNNSVLVCHAEWFLVYITSGCGLIEQMCVALSFVIGLSVVDIHGELLSCESA